MHDILVIKEEGDVSHVNQAHDQQVAKDDKITMRASVHALAPTLEIQMNEWCLISIDIHTQNQIAKESWT